MPDAFLNEPSVIERTRVALQAPAQSPWSAILRKVKNLALAKSPAWLAAGMSPDIVDVEGFEMEAQCYDQWCWAAVGASIGRLSKAGPKPPQCKVAQNQVTNQGDCCEGNCGSNDKPYNKSGKLSLALDFVGCKGPVRCHVNLSNGLCTSLRPKPNLDEIQNEIRNNRPVCFRIGWGMSEDARHHFVVISGFRPDGAVVVKDPKGAETKWNVNYAHFPDSAEPGTILKNTYFIKRD
jgi:hypothetical protein